MSTAGTCIGLLLHTPQSLTSILLSQNSVRFAPCFFELGSLRSPSLYAKSSEPAFGGFKPSRIDYTKELEQRSILLYGVDGGT